MHFFLLGVSMYLVNLSPKPGPSASCGSTLGEIAWRVFALASCLDPGSTAGPMFVKPELKDQIGASFTEMQRQHELWASRYRA